MIHDGVEVLPAGKSILSNISCSRFTAAQPPYRSKSLPKVLSIHLLHNHTSTTKNPPHRQPLLLYACLHTSQPFAKPHQTPVHFPDLKISSETSSLPLEASRTPHPRFKQIYVSAPNNRKLKPKSAARSPTASFKPPYITLGKKITKPLVYVRFSLGVSYGALVDDLVRSSLAGGVSGPGDDFNTPVLSFCSHKTLALSLS
jgi:hypothetical protein